MMVKMTTWKPKWKTSMMFMDVIHVHSKEGKEHGKVRGNIPLETNNYL